MPSQLVGKRYIHSCPYRDPKRQLEVIAVKEHLVYKEEDGRYTAKPNLRFIKNPPRRFWVTKPQYQIYNENKEWEKMEWLDEYVVENQHMASEVYKVLNGYYPKGYVNLRDVNKSPYVYGTDMSIDALIVGKYIRDYKKTNLPMTALSNGFYDIETSMVDDRIIMATVTHNNQVYTAILKDYLFKKDKSGKKIPATLEELSALSQKVFSEFKIKTKKSNKTVLEHGFTFEYHVASTEIDLVKWIFSKIHENKTDFIGAWNMKFDVGRTMDACKRANVDPGEIFCSPEVPEDIRVCRLVLDTNKKVPHWSRKWDWLHCTSHSQFYDALQLYSRQRIVDGFETSYGLDYILKKNINIGKLKFPDLIDPDTLSPADWHRYMQENHPLEYCVYNQFDGISIQIMEIQNQDATGMSILGTNTFTPLSNYNKQTRRNANEFYFICLDRGYVTGSTPQIDENVSEDDLFRQLSIQGGAVLPTMMVHNVGMRCLTERPDFETKACRNVNDVDYKALYPTLCIILNTSRETNLSTLVRLSGYTPKETQNFLSMVISTRENSVPIATQFLNLPGYEELDIDFMKEFNITEKEEDLEIA